MLKAHRNKIAYMLLFLSLPVLFFSTGGLVVTALEDRVEPVTTTGAILLTSVLAAGIIVSLSCRHLVRLSPEGAGPAVAGGARRLVFAVILFVALLSSTLLLLNIVASFFAVSWPMNGLHGVSSEVGKRAWLHHAKTAAFVQANSWGQRDREHALRHEPGTYRVIFIGDSFLENGAAVPLPSRIEAATRKGGMAPVEAINLGVSATDPDEYFFRLKEVGLPLQPDHCVLMFSAGSDFIQEPSLLSYGGISATYPRESFLRLLGLKSLDQVISNERRPLLRAWFKGGPLLAHELELQEIFAKTSSDQETEEMYLSFFPPEEQTILKSVLQSSSAEKRREFYSMLRRPDDGEFRSYYLDIATKVAKGMRAPEFTSEAYSFRWVEKAFQLSRQKGVRFTLVVIPDGFSVDERLSGQYAALADMNAYMKHKDDATNRLIGLATASGMDVVDLRSLLKGHPGAYLNMDGHWSQRGVDLVADYLAQRLGEKGESVGRKPPNP